MGKSLSLSGEDPEQICEIIEEYEDLLSKISKCDLPLALKASAFNNMVLARILHHFYNSRLSEEQFDHMDATLTKIIRRFYGLYETTTQLVIYLPRDHGGIGIKRVSDVYRTTGLAFLVKMLNHPVDNSVMLRENLLSLT